MPTSITRFCLQYVGLFAHLPRVNLLQLPDNQLTQEQLLTPVVNSIPSSAATSTTSRSLNWRLQPTKDPIVTKGPASPPIFTLQYENRQPRSGTSDEATSPQVISGEPSIRHYYGKDLEDHIRLSMGLLTQTQLDTISNLYQLTSKESFVEKLCQTFHDST